MASRETSKNISLPRTVLAAVFFLLALFSKEPALLFPVFFIFLWSDRAAGRFLRSSSSSRLRAVAILIVLGLFFVSLRTRIGSLETPATVLPMLDRLLTFIPVYGEYIFKSLSGMMLTTNDSVTLWRHDSSFLVRSIFSIALVLLQGFALVRIPSTRAGILWFNLFLLPVSQIYPILHFRADRFLYLPTIGLIWACVSAISLLRTNYLFRPALVRRPSFLLLSPILMFFAFRVWDRNPDFENDRALFEPLIQAYPACREAHSLLANEYLIAGEYDKARRAFSLALAVDPSQISYVDYSGTLMSYGVFLLRTGEFLSSYEVLEKLRKATNNSNPETTFNLASAAFKLERYGEAKTLLSEYLLANPTDADALFLMGQVSYNLGHYDDVIATFDTLLREHPDAVDRPAVENLIKEIRLMIEKER